MFPLKEAIVEKLRNDGSCCLDEIVTRLHHFGCGEKSLALAAPSPTSLRLTDHKDTVPQISKEWRSTMTCPKCQTPNVAPTVSWTLCGRKMTPPQVHVWACLNLKCRYEWLRDISSPLVGSVNANDTSSATQIFPLPGSPPSTAPLQVHGDPGVDARYEPAA